ncbi:hypothetical protein ABFT43_01805 [Gordonia sp. B21]
MEHRQPWVADHAVGVADRLRTGLGADLLHRLRPERRPPGLGPLRRDDRRVVAARPHRPRPRRHHQRRRHRPGATRPRDRRVGHHPQSVDPCRRAVDAAVAHPGPAEGQRPPSGVGERARHPRGDGQQQRRSRGAVGHRRPGGPACRGETAARHPVLVPGHLLADREHARDRRHRHDGRTLGHLGPVGAPAGRRAARGAHGPHPRHRVQP